jgi:hypothetical protein
VLTSGSLRVDERGLFFQPDALWARAFGCADGWYVAEWTAIDTVEVRKGGRYSVRRGRLRVLDANGAVLFRGEVAHADVLAMLGATQLVPERARGVRGRRYSTP